CTTEEGVKGARAVSWRLVDQAVPNSKFDRALKEVSATLAAKSDRPTAAKGIVLTALERTFDAHSVAYSTLKAQIEREVRRATITLLGPDGAPPTSIGGMLEQGAQFWSLRLARELDDAILHMRVNEPDIGVLIFKSQGEAAQVLAYDAFLGGNASHWLVREVLNYWKRVLKRVDLTSRSLVTLVEPGSCFVGTLAELVFASDRSFILVGCFQGDNGKPAIVLSGLNFGNYPMSNGLRRLATRFIGEPESVEKVKAELGKPLPAEDANSLGLVTAVFDHIDWA